jgi:hypothetical protein
VHVPTPRHGNVYGGPASERNLRFTLGVFLVNCRQSRARALERGASADVPMHKQLVPNPRYIEWMMGFPRDWTNVPDATDRARPQRPQRPRRRDNGAVTDGDGADGTDGADGAIGPGANGANGTRPRGARDNAVQEPKQFRRNGMHLLMTERGLGVRAASAIWRAMSVDERAVYSARAKTE